MHAQLLDDFEDRLWGVQASFTPEFRSQRYSENVLRLERFDVTGSDFTVGFVRGRMRSGHWGVSFLRQRWKEAAICNDPACFEATGAAHLQGVAANWFLPFGSPFAGDRVQAGMRFDLGAAWLQGTVRADELTGDTGSIRAGDQVPVADLLSKPWDNVPIPLFRAEVAVAVRVAPGVKVIGSGGWGLPFARRIGISVAWFPMAAFR